MANAESEWQRRAERAEADIRDMNEGLGKAYASEARALDQRDRAIQRAERAEAYLKNCNEYRTANGEAWVEADATLARVRKLRDTWAQATQLGGDYEGQLADVVRCLTEALDPKA